MACTIRAGNGTVNEAGRSAMKRSRGARIFKWIGLTLLLIAVAFVAWIWQPESTPPRDPVTILDGPYVAPVTARDRFARAFGGRQRRSVVRAENAFFGQRASIDIRADILQFGPVAATNLEASLNLGTPTFDQTNGLKIWFLPEAKLTELSQNMPKTPGIEALSRPRLMAADGMGASVFIGQSVPANGKMEQVGFGLQCVTTIHENFTELLTEVQHSELRDTLIQTNLYLSARLNVPTNNGILLLKLPTPETTNGFAVIIHRLGKK